MCVMSIDECVGWCVREKRWGLGGRILVMGVCFKV